MALRGAWNFNEASGTYADYGGLSKVMVPSTSAVRVAGRNGVGRALARGAQTGTTGTLVVSSGATALTLYARFMYDGGSGDRGVLTMIEGGSNERAGLYVDGNKLGFWVDGSFGFKGVLGNDAMQSGLWYDLFGVWNGSTLRLWVNGVLLPESTAASGTLPYNINQLLVHYNGTQTGDSGNGLAVDQAMVWNHALTETEIMAALVTEPGAPALPTPHFPGAVHSSGRYLVDASTGQPHFLTLDSAWDLLHVNPNAAKRAAYLSNRAAQGFNTVYVGLIRSDTNGGSTWYGRTPAGNAPFAGATPAAWNLASPNEPFWAEVDALLTAAEAVGITVILQPFTTWDASCFACYTNSTDAQVRAFGAWLGNRYKNRPNVMWLFGGDWGTPDATTTSRAEQLILGIRDSGDTHHFMVHMVEESDGHVAQAGTPGAWTASSTLQAQETVRAAYSYVPTYFRTRVASAATPTKPVFLIEANYEGNPRDSIATDAHVVRRQALWTLVGGGNAGHGYGHGKVFNFQQDGNLSFSWTTNLTTLATQQLAALATRWRALTGWQNLLPDTGNTLVTAGRGTERTSFTIEHVTANDYAPASITPDKSLAVVYVPSARNITLDLTKVGASPTIRVVDPTGAVGDAVGSGSGSTYSIGTASFPAHADGTSDYLVIVTATPPAAATPDITAGVTISVTTARAGDAPVTPGVDISVAASAVLAVTADVPVGASVAALAVRPTPPVERAAAASPGVDITVTAFKSGEPQPAPAFPVIGVSTASVVIPIMGAVPALAAGVSITGVVTKVGGDGELRAYVTLSDGTVVEANQVMIVFGGEAVGPVRLAAYVTE